MPDHCILAHIHGHVQGVGFRYYSQLKARELGLSGWVRNLPDGSVQACICGGPEQVQTMQSWLRHGPSCAKVVRVDFTRVESTQIDSTATDSTTAEINQRWQPFSIR